MRSLLLCCMRKFFCFLFLFICSLIQAQEKPILISGQILVEDAPLSDVHIINKTSELGTITNDNGFFEIPAKKGDVFIISHINLEIQQYEVTQKNITDKKVVIALENKTYLLNEIVIGNTKGIFHVDKDIMPHNLPIVNAKTLKLPYAESEEVKKEKLLKIASGLAIGLGGVLNALNGNNKREKQLEELKLEDHNLSTIRKHFTDGFFVHQLNIKKEHINLFLNKNITSGIVQLYRKNKFLELTTVLLENSKTFPQKNTTQKTNVSLK